MRRKIINVSFPLSGHEELLDALLRYFNLCDVSGSKKNWISSGRADAGPLKYCEYYNHCKEVGCSDKLVNFQKNNDFGGSLPLDQGYDYLILYRHPIENLIAYFEKSGGETELAWKGFALKKVKEWKGFIKKWVLSAPDINSERFSYESLYHTPEAVLTKVLKYFVGDEEVIQENVKKAVHKLSPKSTDLQEFKFFDADFFNHLIELLREELLFLGYSTAAYVNPRKYQDQERVNDQTTHYVYYHNEQLLAQTKPVFNPPKNIEYIDLNELDLPEDLIIEGLSEKDNKAVFSEYFGHLLLEPKSEMVGLFTYSIPLKFCKEHVDFLEINKHFFQPYVTFDLLKDKAFDTTKLYGAEFSSYDWDYDGREIIMEIDEHPDFHLEPLGNGISGPFKGTIVVSRERFLEFQKWFRRVTIYLLDKYGYSAGVSLKKKHIGKYWAEKDLDYDIQFRRGIGQIQERLMAYYFGRTFRDEDKVDLRFYLNEGRFFNLVTYYKEGETDSQDILRNLNNPYIKHIDVLCTNGIPDSLKKVKNLKTHFHSGDFLLVNFMEFANDNFIVENCVIAAPEVEIGESIHNANGYINERSALTLTGYVRFQGGVEQLLVTSRFLSTEGATSGGFLERDNTQALVFQSPVDQNVIERVRNGGSLQDALRDLQYAVYNPCLEVQVFNRQGASSPFKFGKAPNPDHSWNEDNPHWVGAIEPADSKVNLYTYFTPTHQLLFDKWFKPSVKDDFNIRLNLYAQEAKDGVFEKLGWMNTMRHKNDMLTKAVKDNMNDLFVFSDVDIQFFGRIKATLLEELGEMDVLFQRDASDAFGNDKMRGVACSGFFICRGNKRTLSFFKTVRKTFEEDDSIKGDQVAFNRVLAENKMKLKWGYLSDKFFSPGAREAIPGKNWVWAPGVPFGLPEGLLMHHANWTRGIDNKIQQLEYVREKKSGGRYKTWLQKGEDEKTQIEKLKDRLKYTETVETLAQQRARKLSELYSQLSEIKQERDQLKAEVGAYQSSLQDKSQLVEEQYNSITWKIGSFFVKPVASILGNGHKNGISDGE